MTRRKRYSEEFKLEALRRANEEGVTDVLVAEELGINAPRPDSTCVRFQPPTPVPRQNDQKKNQPDNGPPWTHLNRCHLTRRRVIGNSGQVA